MKRLLFLYLPLFYSLLSSLITSAYIEGGQKLIVEEAGNGDLETVRNLVEQSSRVPSNIQTGWALLKATLLGHLDVVKYLVKEGPEASRIPANIRDGLALINAAGNGHLEIVQFLVEEGVPANVRDGQALISAVINGHLEIVQYLVEEGPEASRVPANIGDGQALIDAASNGHLAIVSYLISGLHDFAEDQCRRAFDLSENSQIRALLIDYLDMFIFALK